MSEYKSLSGKHVLIAGGSSGIGLACALEIVKQGAHVFICTHDPKTIKAALEAIHSIDSKSDGMVADVTKASDVENFVKEAVKKFSTIHCAVFSAGLQTYGDVVTTSEETWDLTLNVNCKGAFLLSKYAIPEIIKTGGGSIVNISSVQGMACQQSVAAYATSKAALIALTRATALDFADKNIRVNCVCPGAVDTPMLRNSAEMFRGTMSVEETLIKWGKTHPIGRVAKPEEIANVVTFVLSDKASFMTGTEIKVDGGLIAALRQSRD
eukprot:TRINITY_DN2991_c0_g1_i1.p1 TRINITY_DN2991_c0_g1~~TRINITY_DN2991_c0_g1_i1.p1  ORF type:complete len:280 (-),score=56.85 TRINITY_DN2991_c0_g1_i1:40-840(-)